MSDSGSDPEAIQADIERTRADLASTVDQLSDRLSRQKRQATKVAGAVGAVAGVAVLVVVAVRVVRRRRS